MLMLDKKSSEIFNIVLEMCNKTDGRYIKIDNSDGAFMPLCVEFLYSVGKYSVYSFSHYYKQNGDMCPDPDMTFFVESEKTENIIPATFQDSRVYQQICEISRIGELKVNGLNQLSNLCKFSKLWLNNIYEQQELKMEGVTA